MRKIGLIDGLTYDDHLRERSLQWDNIEEDAVYKRLSHLPFPQHPSHHIISQSPLFRHITIFISIDSNPKVKMLTLPIILSVIPLALAAPVNEPRAVNALALDAKGVDFIAGFEGFRATFYTDAAVRCSGIQTYILLT